MWARLKERLGLAKPEEGESIKSKAPQPPVANPSLTTGFGFTLKEKTIDEVLADLELVLLESDVALKVVERIQKKLREDLQGKKLRWGEEASDAIEHSLRDSLKSILALPGINLEENLRQGPKPYTILFLGVNGSGKTTTLAKLAHQLSQKGHSVQVTVNTIWQHPPFAWTEVDTETGWCSVTCPTAAQSTQAWFAWDPSDQYLLLLTAAGGSTGTYEYALTPSESYPILSNLAQGCQDTCPPSETAGTSAAGTFWGSTEIKVGANTYSIGPNVEFVDGSSTYDYCMYNSLGDYAYYPWYCVGQTVDKNPAGASQTAFYPDSYYSNIGGETVYYDDLGKLVTVPTPFYVGSVLTLTCQFPKGTTITCPTHLVPSTGTVSGAAMTWDPADGYILLYDTGGYSWEVTLSSATAATAVEVSSSLGPPGVLHGESMAYDAACGYVVMFGGSNALPITSTSLNANTWKYHAGTWTQLFPSSSPTPRAWAAMDYDYSDGGLVLYGGTVDTGTATGTTTAYTLSPAIGGCP